MENAINRFGTKVFNDKVMRERLSEQVYADLERVICGDSQLTADTADAIAEQMKIWAMELGATHFTHWFQPMTGITAEKHDSFIEPAEGGGVIAKFSGKNLIKGEPDASSFPSGGLRATFEARGYTAWDPTSYAFVKDRTLYIPTCFFSYDGSALDKKTPLLRSVEALNKQALRILRLFGNKDAKKVIANVGPEQEYFLIDKNIAEMRPDIMLCGRTLLGYKPPKGQEMDDHYFGTLNARVDEYMHALDSSLWEHGVYAKTKHNEVAPAQHELAPVYSDVNKATDQNQLTMDYMKMIALRQGMVCLLHEKPFNSVNGSGKHNNWSLATDTGVNLLDPGKSPRDNAQFILFLTATIAAVDEYQELLRASVASAGNDHRLGANEAPPAIVSVFLGNELSSLLDSVETGGNFVAEKHGKMQLGVQALPTLNKDATDRNRTSPFAFTGNKFEFRMVGSSASIASANIVINTAVAEMLCRFADQLEGAKDFDKALSELLKKTVSAHKRIIFNGNNYSDEWKKEAESRGLKELKTTVDAIPAYVSAKSIDLFTKHKVFNNVELMSRCDVMLENYYKTVNIECQTLLSMLRTAIIPACFAYEKQLCDLVRVKMRLLSSADKEKAYLNKVSRSTAELIDIAERTENLLTDAEDLHVYEKAKFFRDKILPEMENARNVADDLESIFPKDLWPYPSYTDILYSVR